MGTKCTTPKELAEAIKNKEDSIVIEGDLKNKVIRIKATGTVAWGICFAALAAAVALYMAIPAATVATTLAGGAGGAVMAVGGSSVAGIAAVILGSSATTAITIGVAAGGVGALTVLRDRYKIVEKDDKHIKLQRK